MVDAAQPLPSFGQRLRARRVAAGLSQADVAGPGVSASYVSLLEAGKRVPTPAVVDHLARRLSCSADYLLTGVDPSVRERVTLAVRYGELALGNGEPDDALRYVATVLASVDAGPELTRQAQTVQARALEALGRLEEAAQLLDSLARRAAEEGRWDEHLARTIDLVRCHQEAGDVAYALDLGLAALERVRRLGLAGSDVYAELVSTVVGAYYVRGDLLKAGQLAAEALSDVQARGSARARGAVLWNASLVAEANDNLADALVLAERAVALFAEGADARALARLRVAYGWLLLRSDPPAPEPARQVLEAALEALRDVGSVIDIAYCETELARCLLALGRADEALSLTEQALGRYPYATRLEAAATRLVRARVLLATGRRDEAIEDYRRAAAQLAALEVSRHAAAAWRELADAFTELGLWQDAALAYQQALSEVGVRPAPQAAAPASTVAHPST